MDKLRLGGSVLRQAQDDESGAQDDGWGARMKSIKMRLPWVSRSRASCKIITTMKHALPTVMACALALTIACSGQQSAPTATAFATPIPTSTPAPETDGVRRAATRRGCPPDSGGVVVLQRPPGRRCRAGIQLPFCDLPDSYPRRPDPSIDAAWLGGPRRKTSTWTVKKRRWSTNRNPPPIAFVSRSKVGE